MRQARMDIMFSNKRWKKNSCIDKNFLQRLNPILGRNRWLNKSLLNIYKRKSFDKMRFSDLIIFKNWKRDILLKNRPTASRKSSNRYKFFFVAFKFLRERYKF